MPFLGPGQGVVPVVGDILELVIHTKAQDQAGINVRHYRVASVAAGGVALGPIVEHFESWFASAYKPLMSLAAAWEGSLISKVWPLPRSAASYSIDAQGPGAVVGDLMSTQTCGIITLYTNRAGRSGRGRAFIPFPSETDNGPDGNPTAAYTNNLITLASVLTGDVTVTLAGATTILNPVIWKRGTDQHNVISTRFAQGVWATQRRRGAKGRPNAAWFPE